MDQKILIDPHKTVVENNDKCDEIALMKPLNINDSEKDYS